MSNIAFKAFGIFCFSIICFGIGTFLAGVIISGGNDNDIIISAWFIGCITFGIAMAIAYT